MPKILGDRTPVGNIIDHPVDTPPPGYLLCDGRAISRTQYAALYATIGTTYGSGDGSTTFNIPDRRGYFVRGVDGTAGRDPDKATRTHPKTGSVVGGAVGSVQGDINKSHSHTDSGHDHFSTTESFGMGESGNIYDDDNTRSALAYFGQPRRRTSVNSANIQPDGGNEARPKNVYTNYFIKYI